MPRAEEGSAKGVVASGVSPMKKNGSKMRPAVTERWPRRPSLMALAVAAALGGGMSQAEESGEEWKPVSTISGTIEVEASAWDGDSGEGSDIKLAKVELGFDAHLNQYTHGHLLFLYEEGEEDDRIRVDEATITIANPAVSPAFFRAGRMYVPFGKFETNMVSDPLTLEIAEAQAELAQAVAQLAAIKKLRQIGPQEFAKM